MRLDEALEGPVCSHVARYRCWRRPVRLVLRGQVLTRAYGSRRGTTHGGIGLGRRDAYHAMRLLCHARYQVSVPATGCTRYWPRLALSTGCAVLRFGNPVSVSGRKRY
eukprot:2410521-Rhodomonas_salina.1